VNAIAFFDKEMASSTSTQTDSIWMMIEAGETKNLIVGTFNLSVMADG
jgi:hypothetical protein